MIDDTLLGHLMVRLPIRKENIATEALRFVLTRTPAVSDAFSRLLASFGAEVGRIASFDIQQASDDRSIPDMLCRDVEGDLAAVVENKFWAAPWYCARTKRRTRARSAPRSWPEEARPTAAQPAEIGRNRNSRFGVSDGNKQTFVLGDCQRKPRPEADSRWAGQIVRDVP